MVLILVWLFQKGTQFCTQHPIEQYIWHLSAQFLSSALFCLWWLFLYLIEWGTREPIMKKCYTWRDCCIAWRRYTWVIMADFLAIITPPVQSESIAVGQKIYTTLFADYFKTRHLVNCLIRNLHTILFVVAKHFST